MKNAAEAQQALGGVRGLVDRRSADIELSSTFSASHRVLILCYPPREGGSQVDSHSITAHHPIAPMLVGW